MPTAFRRWLRPTTGAKARTPRARLGVESLEARDVPATFTVTTVADAGAGSLRQAINDANAAAGADTIAFAIGSGPTTISPLSNLPQVVTPMTIDGWSQPGFAGTPIVELSGASAGNAWGLIVGATATVRGLVINRFTYDAIHVEGAGSVGTRVQGCYLGTNAAGTAAAANGYAGVAVWTGATGTVVGTDGDGVNDAAEGNVISGNTNEGVWVYGATTRNTVVAGNRVGTNAAGTAAIPNVNDCGVAVLNGAADTRIGTNGDGVSDALERNVLSGNAHEGVKVLGGSLRTVLAGNFIGTDAAGTLAIPNGYAGVYVAGGATNTVVGTNGDGSGDAAEGNVISGNADTGVTVIDAATRFTVVAGNYIGTNAAGTAAVANRGNAGVLVSAAADTRVGTNGDGVGDPAERNVISGNTEEGVQIESAAARTVVAGNMIGLTAAGTAKLANGYSGVLVWFGATNTRVGTDGNGSGDAAERNVISGNGFEGVRVSTAGTAGTVVAGNFIGTNALGTAALGNTNAGVALFGGATNTVVGTNGDGSGDAAEGNLVSGNGGEGVFVLGGAAGTVIAGNVIGTNAAGTAAVANGNHGVRIEGGAADTRVGTNGDGAGDAAEGNLISGNTYDGVSFWTGGATATVIAGNRIGTNAAGTAALANGRHGVWVNSGATNTRVGTNADGVSDALERNVISGNGADGVQVADSGTTGTVIAGNYIGTNAAGDAAVGNLGVGGGVYVRNGASNTTVGGAAAGAGNVLSGNSGVNGDGVEIELSSGNFVTGNRIGTDATGAFAVPNRQNGVNLDRASGNVVGGPAPGAGNLISGNTRSGVLIGSGGAATGNRVQGNRIGTNAAATAAIPNVEQGVILLAGAANNWVGTDGDGANDAAEGNVVSGNGLQGVLVSGASVTGNAVRGNAISGNAGLGIDLGGDGVTPNDSLDADSGANGLQNFPVLTARTGPATRVAGVLASKANTTYLLDFYANPAGTTQGGRYLGAATVTTDAAGNAHFDVTLAGSTASGEAVTATATAADGTSEFSAPARAPVAVEGVVVNRGQAQRSMVTRLDVTFTGVIPTVDASAFALTQAGGANVGLAVTSAVVGGKTVVTVTFTGPGVVAGSLADGNYTLAIDGAKLFDADGVRADADGDGLAGGAGSTSLFRLFGDSDGDRDVDNTDFARLRTVLLNPSLYASYAYFDFDGDGVIGAADRAAFDARRGTVLSP